MNAKFDNSGLSLYRLIPILQKESELLKLSVSSNDLNREVNCRYSDLDDRLNGLWKNFDDKELTTAGLLKEVAIIYGPVD